MRRPATASGLLRLVAGVFLLVMLLHVSAVSASRPSLDSRQDDTAWLPRGAPQQRLYARQASTPTTTSATATYSELPTAAITIDGQPPPTSSGDPLLALMPDFAFSMPAQIVVDGINIALISVLLIHLLFTVQYHFPSAAKTSTSRSPAPSCSSSASASPFTSS